MLERTVQRLTSVASRQTGLAVWLWGEAGVGKSYALEGLLKSVGCRTLRLSAHLDLGRLLLSLPQTPVPSWLEHTQARLKRGETLEQTALLQALCAALEALAPVVVALEDLPSAPLEKREAWTALALRMVRLKGVALLVTGRESPPPGWESVQLEAMTETQTTALLEGQVGAALPYEAGNWVYTRSQGNPALTLELFRFLVQGGSLHSDGSRWHWRVPPEGRVPIGVEALLLERVQPWRTDPALERVLLAHALLPEAPERVQVLAGLPPEQWETQKTRLEREGLLRGGLFILPMLAEVLSQSLSAADRMSWARERIAVLCQDPPDYLAAVRGLENAWLEPPQTQDLLRSAAEQAEARGYRGRAAELWTEVLRWAALDERLSLTRKVAWLLREVQPLEALKHIARVTALVPDDAEALLLEAELLALSGRSSEAESRLSDTLRDRPELEERWQERLLAVRYRLDDMAGVLALHAQNPALLERGVALQVRVGYALGRQGRYAEALKLYQQALEQPNDDPLERAWLLSAFAALEFEGGDLERAVKHFGQALEKLTSLSSPEAEQRRTVVLYNRSQALYRLRRLPEATQDLEAALERLNLSGDGEGVAEAQVNLALFYLMGAQYRAAESLLAAARLVLERSESAQSLLRLETALLQLYLEEGGEVGRRVAPLHLHRALALLPAVAPLEQAQSLYFVGWAEAVYGDPETALQHAQTLAKLCETHALNSLKPAVDAIVGHALERGGDPDAAAERFEAAYRGYLHLGQPDWADHFGLEADRLRGNLASVATQLERLNAAGLHSWVEGGYRAFPQLQTLRELRGEIATPRPAKATPASIPRLEVLGSLRVFSSEKTLTPPAEPTACTQVDWITE